MIKNKCKKELSVGYEQVKAFDITLNTCKQDCNIFVFPNVNFVQLIQLDLN